MSKWMAPYISNDSTFMPADFLNERLSFIFFMDYILPICVKINVSDRNTSRNTFLIPRVPHEFPHKTKQKHRCEINPSNAPTTYLLTLDEPKIILCYIRPLFTPQTTNYSTERQWKRVVSRNGFYY